MSDSNGSLLVVDKANFEVTTTLEAQEAREVALGTAALVVKVDNEDQQAMAVGAQRDVHMVITQTEKDRKTVKSPVIELGRKIDRAAQGFVTELKGEELRIGKLVGDYQALLMARARAVEAQKLKDLEAADRERQARIANAESHEEIEQAHEEFQKQAVLTPAVPEVKKEKGQVVKEVWEFVITDRKLFAQAHWNFVRDIVIDRQAVKDALQAGMKLQGVEAKKVVKASVR